MHAIDVRGLKGYPQSSDLSEAIRRDAAARDWHRELAWGDTIEAHIEIPTMPTGDREVLYLAPAVPQWEHGEPLPPENSQRDAPELPTLLRDSVVFSLSAWADPLAEVAPHP